MVSVSPTFPNPAIRAISDHDMGKVKVVDCIRVEVSDDHVHDLNEEVGDKEGDSDDGSGWDSEATLELEDFGFGGAGAPLERMVMIDGEIMAESTWSSTVNSLGALEESSDESTEDSEPRNVDEEGRLLQSLYYACREARFQYDAFDSDVDEFELGSAVSEEDGGVESDSDTSSVGYEEVDFERTVDELFPTLSSSPSSSSLSCARHNRPYTLSLPQQLSPLTVLPLSPSSKTLLLLLTLNDPALRADPWNPVVRIISAVDRSLDIAPIGTQGTIYLLLKHIIAFAPFSSSSDTSHSTPPCSFVVGTPHTQSQWLDFIRQTLEGLVFLHECGIAHRGFRKGLLSEPGKGAGKEKEEPPFVMMDISADPSTLSSFHSTSPSISSTEGSGGLRFNRFRYPTKYYFTNLEHATQVFPAPKTGSWSQSATPSPISSPVPSQSHDTSLPTQIQYIDSVAVASPSLAAARPTIITTSPKEEGESPTILVSLPAEVSPQYTQSQSQTLPQGQSQMMRKSSLALPPPLARSRSQDESHSHPLGTRLGLFRSYSSKAKPRRALSGYASARVPSGKTASLPGSRVISNAFGPISTPSPAMTISTRSSIATTSTTTASLTSSSLAPHNPSLSSHPPTHSSSRNSRSGSKKGSKRGKAKRDPHHPLFLADVVDLGEVVERICLPALEELESAMSPQSGRTSTIGVNSPNATPNATPKRSDMHRSGTTPKERNIHSRVKASHGDVPGCRISDKGNMGHTVSVVAAVLAVTRAMRTGTLSADEVRVMFEERIWEVVRAGGLAAEEEIMAGPEEEVKYEMEKESSRVGEDVVGEVELDLDLSMLAKEKALEQGEGVVGERRPADAMVFDLTDDLDEPIHPPRQPSPLTLKPFSPSTKKPAPLGLGHPGRQYSIPRAQIMSQPIPVQQQPSYAHAHRSHRPVTPPATPLPGQTKFQISRNITLPSSVSSVHDSTSGPLSHHAPTGAASTDQTDTQPLPKLNTTTRVRNHHRRRTTSPENVAGDIGKSSSGFGFVPVVTPSSATSASETGARRGSVPINVGSSRTLTGPDAVGGPTLETIVGSPSQRGGLTDVGVAGVGHIDKEQEGSQGTPGKSSIVPAPFAMERSLTN